VLMRVIDRELQRQFWLLVRTGLLATEAAHALGVRPNAGQRWFRDAGGMPPMSLDPPATRRYLCVAEREQIHAGIHAGLSIRAIARGLDRAPSTVLRELRLNMAHQRYRSRRSLRPRPSGSQVRKPWKYSPSWAQGRAERARARPKVAKLADNDRLRGQVQEWLEEKYSPEQISHRLRCDFAQDPEMRVSHETIYQSLYVQGRGALRRDLTVCLRTGRTLRRPRRRPGERRGRITDMVNRLGTRFDLLCGVDDLVLENLLFGAVGWVSGLANSFPREAVELFKLAKAGRTEEALALYRWFMPLLHLDVAVKLLDIMAEDERGEILRRLARTARRAPW